MVCQLAEARSGRTFLVRLAGAATIAFAMLGSVASAHAVVDDISPADGSVVLDAPQQVVVEFSEPVLEEFVEIEIISSGADEVGQPTSAIDPSDGSRLIITLPPLVENTYQVRISARDAEDLHEVVARTTFSVGGEAPQPSPPVLSKPIPLEAASRWLFLLGLAAVLGGFVFRSRWPDIPMARVHLAEPLTAVGLGAIFVGRLGVIASRGLDLGVGAGDAVSALMSTSDVRRLPMVVLAILCIVPTAVRRVPIWLDLPLRDGHSLTVRQALGWTGAGWLVLMAAWSDHSALGGSVEVTTALAKALHLWGVALWIGVLGVAIILNAGRGTLRSALNAVSSTAVAAAVLAAASGLLLMGRLVVSLTGLLTSPYGMLLIGKLAVLSVAIVLGVRLRTGGEGGRRAHGEWVALTMIALMGAAMATAGPAVESSFLAADDVASSVVSNVRADDLLVQIQPIPGTAGLNQVQVRVHDTRRPAPAPFGAIRLVDADGVAFEAQVVDGNAFFDDVELQPGSNSLGVVVERSDWPDASAEIALETVVPVYRHPVRISSAASGSVTRIAGAVLLIVAIRLWLVARRRRTTEPPTQQRSESTWSPGELARR